MSKKLSPYDAFVDNINDSIALMRYARAFENKRNRRMRQELRTRVGAALKVPINQREDLDCLENTNVFVVFKPGGRFSKDHFTDSQPLLRQSLVAACAAFETYVADRAMEFVGTIVSSREVPPRMGEINLTVGDWAEIEKKYKNRGWGIRSMIEKYIRETSSTAPNSVGFVLSTIGVKNWATRIDDLRRVGKGTTVRELDEITERRNRIAHAADRKGRGRASAKFDEIGPQVVILKEVVDAINELLKKHDV